MLRAELQLTIDTIDKLTDKLESISEKLNNCVSIQKIQILSGRLDQISALLQSKTNAPDIPEQPDVDQDDQLEGTRLGVPRIHTITLSNAPIIYDQHDEIYDLNTSYMLQDGKSYVALTDITKCQFVSDHSDVIAYDQTTETGEFTITNYHINMQQLLWIS